MVELLEQPHVSGDLATSHLGPGLGNRDGILIDRGAQEVAYEALADGTVDVLISDGQCDATMKGFGDTRDNVPAILEPVEAGVLPLSRAVATTTSNVARLMADLTREDRWTVELGHLGAGARANVTVVDPHDNSSPSSSSTASWLLWRAAPCGRRTEPGAGSRSSASSTARASGTWPLSPTIEQSGRADEAAGADPPAARSREASDDAGRGRRRLPEGDRAWKPRVGPDAGPGARKEAGGARWRRSYSCPYRPKRHYPGRRVSLRFRDSLPGSGLSWESSQRI